MWVVAAQHATIFVLQNEIQIVGPFKSQEKAIKISHDLSKLGYNTRVCRLTTYGYVAFRRAIPWRENSMT
jgi:hypothetical protein